MSIESSIWNQWYPLAVVEDLVDGRIYRTSLLGHEIRFGRDAEGHFSATRDDDGGSPCRTTTLYHTHWVCLGEPDGDFSR